MGGTKSWTGLNWGEGGKKGECGGRVVANSIPRPNQSKTENTEFFFKDKKVAKKEQRKEGKGAGQIKIEKKENPSFSTMV